MSGGDNRLFLYGTLRTGQVAHYLVASNVARSAPATTDGILYALPMGYPGYIPGAGVVVGELVWLTDIASTLQRLDDYEGDEFLRVVRPMQLPSGQTMSAWIYELTDAPAVGSEIIESGDWVRHLQSSLER